VRGAHDIQGTDLLGDGINDQVTSAQSGRAVAPRAPSRGPQGTGPEPDNTSMIIESSFMPGAQSESPAAAPPEGDGTNSIPGFERFNPDMRFSDFGGDMDRFSWTQIVAQERPADINVHKLRAREQELAGGTSVFAAQLAANLERRGEEKVMVSNLNL
jgi:hypothetical protein